MNHGYASDQEYEKAIKQQLAGEKLRKEHFARKRLEKARKKLEKAAPALLAACKGFMNAWIQPKSRSMDVLKMDMDDAYSQAEKIVAQAEKE